MMDKDNSITCKEVDELFILPISKGTIEKIRVAVLHISNCPACQKKYSTLDSLVDKILEK